MNRDVDINEISDGKTYDAGDMAKLGVNDCSGCHACCCGMGDSITLDPYDVYRLEKGLGSSFEELLSDSLELRVADGVILPCLKMGENDSCIFLNEQGRCSIHTHRPGICRLFPLGRIYENKTHKYFLQVNECHKERTTKIKIKKWIDTAEFNRYEAYIDKWHYFIKNIADSTFSISETELKDKNMTILKLFYLVPYDISKDFYDQFEERMKKAESA